jgi:Tfp pilus assembly protein PilN
MANINFVPDDYVQSNESRRANLMCLVLFSVVIAALGGSCVMIKIRQRACRAEEALVNAKMARMNEAIAQFEQLQTKRKEMMKTALTTAELIEPVPRSILLASLTNNLPTRTSLVKLDLVQKEPPKTPRPKPSPQAKYQAAQGPSNAGPNAAQSPEKLLETHMEIEGVAPSDVQVADYMQLLERSLVLTNVALIESKETKVDGATFRRFKLKAMLSREIRLTKDDVDEIRAKAERSVYQF